MGQSIDLDGDGAPRLEGFQAAEATISCALTAAVDTHAREEPLVLLLVTHRGSTRLVRLDNAGPGAVIGRQAPADVVIDDPKLSRAHARIKFAGTDLLIEDLCSKNGTFLEGRRVDRPEAFHPGQRVVVGDATAVVQLLAPAGFEGPAFDTHPQFLGELDKELVRSRSTLGSVALMMIERTVDPPLLSSWPTIIGELRPTDHVALYSGGLLEIMLSDAPDKIVGRTRRLYEAVAKQGAALAAAVVSNHAVTSAEELLELARRSLAERDESHPFALFGLDQRDNETTSTPRIEVARSPAMQRMFSLVERASRSAITILIRGETGTGKELVARSIHEQSDRALRPMRIVNCGAIPAQLLESTLFGHEKGAFTGAVQRTAGVFESAAGGTVFLDEVAELPLAAQAALLRVLETQRVTRVGSQEEIVVDARIIAATHQNLEEMCEKGLFRLDLFYRLNVLAILVPPLRERRDEIEQLVQAFIVSANERNKTEIEGIDPAALRLIVAHDWPGNVRELRNVIDRAVVIAEQKVITAAELPEPFQRLQPSGGPAKSAGPDFKTRIREYEVDLITRVLEETRWNQREAARRLRIPLRTLAHKIVAYSLRARKQG